MAIEPNKSLLPQSDQHIWDKLKAELQASPELFDSQFLRNVESLVIASSFALDQACKNHELLIDLKQLEKFDLDKPALLDGLLKAQDIAQVKQLLRRYRHRKLIEIIYLDVIQNNPLENTLLHLSDLADFLISQALEQSEKRLCVKHGQPFDSEQNPLQLNIIAMGKLGGRELNFSSDIDLICCYATDGELTGMGHLTHQEYFSRVVRQFSQLLNDTTEDGFVYRVDLRLRPWGDSGPVVLSHAAFEHYYQLHGREWEQYAMVKARVLTGSDGDKSYLKSILKPFVYRKYHDYRVFEGLALLKDKIDLQAKLKHMQDNIKLGQGGIREIEFFVQAFQILKGGRNQLLQSTQILNCLDILKQQKIIEATIVDQLTKAYCFLRQLENKIQMLNDEQTHKCPADEASRDRIAFSMHQSNWTEVYDLFSMHRQFVSETFNDIFKRETEAKSDFIPDNPIDESGDNTQQIEFMQKIGVSQPEVISRSLQIFFKGKAWGYMSAKAKQRFSGLLPLLLRTIAYSEQPSILFDRLLNLFSSIAGRSVYFELLHQNTALLGKLSGLFDKSEWIAQEVARYPMLLEHLIHPGELSERFKRDALEQNLDTQLTNVIDDIELELDVLRLFKREQTIVIASAELSEEIDTLQVGCYLTELAEILLNAVHRLASKALQKKHGEPQYEFQGKSAVADIAIIGYGKLGGHEMHYQSDLDIIFLHNSIGEKQFTSGP